MMMKMKKKTVVVVVGQWRRGYHTNKYNGRVVTETDNGRSFAVKLQLPSIPKFRHDCFSYNRILLILSGSSKPDRLESVRAVVSEMERLNVCGNISTVNILIGIFGSDDDGMCMRLVKKWELKMNRYTYKCLLQAHLCARDSDKGLLVYQDMIRKGYYPDIFAYNMLLDALAKDHKEDEDMEEDVDDDDET